VKDHCNGNMCVVSSRGGGCECACQTCCDAMFSDPKPGPVRMRAAATAGGTVNTRTVIHPDGGSLTISVATTINLLQSTEAERTVIRRELEREVIRLFEMLARHEKEGDAGC